jgi:hypothetical protein
MTKEILYIDMDNVLVDFQSGISRISPELAAKYEEMAENGEEKYGYHYNETIQNMLFNDYVLNSPKYLQKYKQAVPKEKKRRDKRIKERYY